MKGRCWILRNIILHVYKLINATLTDIIRHALWDSYLSRSSFLSRRCPRTPNGQVARVGEKHAPKINTKGEGTLRSNHEIKRCLILGRKAMTNETAY